MFSVRQLRYVFAVACCTAIVSCAPRDPATWRNSEQCLSAFLAYDSALQSAGSSGQYGETLPGSVSRRGLDIIRKGCVTRQRDLVGLEQRAAGFIDEEVGDFGEPLRNAAVHAGIVAGLTSQARVTTYFSSLGFNTRSVGADGVGRRIYIGPLRSEGAVEQAIEAARAAGFISPYLSERRF